MPFGTDTGFRVAKRSETRGLSLTHAELRCMNRPDRLLLIAHAMNLLVLTLAIISAEAKAEDTAGTWQRWEHVLESDSRNP